MARMSSRSRPLGQRVQLALHAKGLGEQLQVQTQVVLRELAAGELHPHEKQTGAVVVVLGGFFDVAAAFQQETRDGVHDAGAVLAGQGEDVGVVHGKRIVAGRPGWARPGTRQWSPQAGHSGARIQPLDHRPRPSCATQEILNMAYNEFRMDNQWLPFTPNRSFQKDPRIFVAADGMHFTTHDGKQVIDGISSLWCVGAGHNRKPINEAIKKQLDTLDYATAFSVSNDKAFRAAEMIAAMAPGDLNKVLFCNSGSEAADTSLKVALAYHRARGEGHRNLFIGRERGYHGVNFGGMSVGGIPANRKAYGSLLPRVDHLPHTHNPAKNAFSRGQPAWGAHLADELETRIIALHDASNIAAVIVEPVAGSTGVLVPPKGYLERLRAICDKYEF